MHTYEESVNITTLNTMSAVSINACMMIYFFKLIFLYSLNLAEIAPNKSHNIGVTIGTFKLTLA